MVNRRRFVLAFSAMVAGFARLSEATTNHVPAKNWWASRLDRAVELQGGHWHLVQLVKVEDHSNRLLEQFTLVFKGGVGDPVTEGIFDVKLVGGTVQLFVQPSGSDELATYSHATISRGRPGLRRLLRRQRAQLRRRRRASRPRRARRRNE